MQKHLTQATWLNSLHQIELEGKYFQVGVWERGTAYARDGTITADAPTDKNHFSPQLIKDFHKDEIY